MDTLNVLFREYNVRSLKYLRHRVEDARTYDELRIISDMVLTIGRYHEVGPGK